MPDGENWTVTEYYYNASWQVMEIRRDGGKTRSGTPLSEPTLATTLHEQYVWSPRYIDSPVLRWRDTGTDGTVDETLYYLTDANMNVTALVDGTSGSGTFGQAVERYVYEPYGAVTFYQADWQKTQLGQETPGTLSAYANDILYCGYRRDAETGLYDVRNRVYHPLLGRWLQRDPLGYVDGMSLYEYCGGGPMGATDPSRTAAGPLDRRHLLHSGESDQRQ